MAMKKKLTKRQEDALKRHKKKGTHTKKHMDSMVKDMLKGMTFTEAHKRAMKGVGR
ncbi:hypothetical protein [Hyphomonas sp.]|uniref:hypothetical protein n=1 Tax=Hyphomonas sp. TaxID=87 RepID=UPI0025C1037A|nr:hypothetical protein [Hyphomonas sp.]|tara:strand:+ start:2959 stop:3126 length:168 start_codon:yes stop_codon:yes gene_type:complete